MIMFKTVNCHQSLLQQRLPRLPFVSWTLSLFMLLNVTLYLYPIRSVEDLFSWTGGLVWCIMATCITTMLIASSKRAQDMGRSGTKVIVRSVLQVLIFIAAPFAVNALLLGLASLSGLPTAWQQHLAMLDIDTLKRLSFYLFHVLILIQNLELAVTPGEPHDNIYGIPINFHHVAPYYLMVLLMLITVAVALLIR